MPYFHCRGHRFDPQQETKIPHAVLWGKKKKNEKKINKMGQRAKTAGSSFLHPIKWPWISSMKHQDLKFLEYYCSNAFFLMCTYIMPIYAYIYIIYIYVVHNYYYIPWVHMNTFVKLVQMKDRWVIVAIYLGKQLMYPCTCCCCC